MRRKKVSSKKSLFDLPQKEQEEPTKKRRRKRKDVSTEPAVETVEKPKRGRRKKKQETVTTKSDWKNFLTDTKPECLKPLEFYVDTGNGKQDIFRGFIKEPGVTATDEPYKLVVLRRKHGNLYYREIPGCDTVENCPNNFPNCELCGRNKK